MGGFTIWDILGVAVLLGPLIAAVLSLTSAFIYTAYRDLFDKHPTYSTRAVALISVSLGSIMITGIGYAFLRPVNFRPQTVAPSGVLTMDGGVDFRVSWDADGRIEVEEIDWGVLQPGETANKTFYVINLFSEPLYFSVAWNESSWFPENAAQFFKFKVESFEGSLQPNQTRPIVIGLYVSPRISGVSSFRFDIVVKGSTEPFT